MSSYERATTGMGLRSASVELLSELRNVLDAPVSDMAKPLSNLLAPYVAHSGLFMLTRHDVHDWISCLGAEIRTGEPSFSELNSARTAVPSGGVSRHLTAIGDVVRPTLGAHADGGAFLLLTDPGTEVPEGFILGVWQLVALQLDRAASDASPAYLRESRALSSIQARAITEITDRQTTTLESLVAMLRSASLDDRAARRSATNLAATALVQIRTSTDRARRFAEEPVTSAFERLRSDLRPLVRYRDIEVQFVEPPLDGRALPSEVAHGARAVVCGAVLGLVDQPGVRRVRIQWDCDGTNLLINVRDDGSGGISAESSQLQPVRQRVRALGGVLELEAIRGWGCELAVVLPLDPLPAWHAESWDLAPREREVLELLAVGQRNRAIGVALGISENTVKFHVSNVLKKLGVASRAEIGALVAEHRFPAG